MNTNKESETKPCTIQNVVATEGKLCPECKSIETINYTVNDKEMWKCFDCGCDFEGHN